MLLTRSGARGSRTVGQQYRGREGRGRAQAGSVQLGQLTEVGGERAIEVPWREVVRKRAVASREELAAHEHTGQARTLQ